VLVCAVVASLKPSHAAFSPCSFYLPQKHLKALSGYGEEHMLVKKARELHAEAAAPAAGGGDSGSSNS
jgi:hypothetical protein